MASNTQGRTGRAAPISAHPAFAAVVALWFAALLGLGSLVLPAVLFEKIVSATGLGEVVPAAAPPLGLTARLAIAFAGAAGGAAIGWLVARKVALAQAGSTPRTPRARSAEHSAPGRPDQARAKRPISAREELGSESLDEPIAEERAAPLLNGRRRPLSVTDDSGPSEFFDHAPLPGMDGAADETPLPILPAVATAPDEPEGPSDPLELDGFAAEDSDQAAPEPQPVFGRRKVTLPGIEAAPEMDAIIPDGNQSAPSTVPESAHFTPPGPAATLREELSAMHDRLSQPRTVAYSPFASRAPEPQAQPEPAAAMPEPQAAADARPLRELGMAELVERFASALQRSAAAAPAPRPVAAPAPAVAEPVPTAFTRPAAAEPTAFETPAFASAAAPLPFHSLLHHDNEVDDADEHLADLTLPLDRFPLAPTAEPVTAPSAPAPAPVPSPYVPSSLVGAEPFEPSFAKAPFGQVDVEDEDEGEDTADAGYSSLLSMKTPFGSAPEFVRIEDEAEPAAGIEPVVVFPGQDQRRAVPAADGPARDPLGMAEPIPPARRPFDAPQGIVPRPVSTGQVAETERALREALEKLQRLSGAA